MEIVRHRILTFKSVIGMGTYGDIPIERLLHINPKGARYAYYKFDAIDFAPEVKDAAGIRIEIPKPGHDWLKYVENEKILRGELTDEERIKQAAEMKHKRKVERTVLYHGNALGRHMSKGYLQGVNHGRNHFKK